jgi:FkbM family methyltransferase
MSLFLYFTKLYIFNILELIKSTVWKLNLSKRHRLEIINNQYFNFTHYGIITQLIHARQHVVGKPQGFESETLKRYAAMLKTGDTVLDIGANVGVFSLLGSSLVGEKGHIYAFEPSQKTFNALTENLSINGIKNVHPQRLALSNTEGVIYLGNVANDALNFIDKNNQKGEAVDMITLDKWLAFNNIQKVDFIKIDIEGAEKLCFEGASDMLKKTPPTIIMECNETWCKRFEYTVFDLLQFLNTFGYTFEQYEEAQWICYPPKK